MKFYLRMEAVNISQFISDCEDLSTFRGGGLLLLNSPQRLVRTFPKIGPLSLGGSSALFEFEAESGSAAAQMRNDVENFFNSDSQLCHATFVVDVFPASGDFVQDREMILAQNRWRQMQSPTVAVPQIAAELPCRIDKVRPGNHWENDQPVSTSVKIRRDYGREQKQAFYKAQTGIDCPHFVNNFDELTFDESRGNLHHKMAVVHLDGNRFGKIQDEFCRDSLTFAQFDKTLRTLRSDMLRELLQKTIGQLDWVTADGKHRIETLLWGGDEIVWVVPAWVGLWLLNFFYGCSQTWRFPEDGTDQRPLTHSGGIVFCHHNAPIHRITGLVRDLSEHAKNVTEHASNVFAYQILESFDNVGTNLTDVMNERLPDDCVPSTLLLSAKGLERVIGSSRKLKSVLPRNKTHDISHVLLKRDVATLKRDTARADQLAKKTLRGLPKTVKDEFHALAADLGGERMAWVHLAALWDYIPE